MSSKITGLVSGFDTQSIVESFMAIEKVPMTKLEYKKESADVKLQAYQAVNTYLSKFKNSMNTLASKSLWNSKAAVSTNEKAMIAKASEYAVNGSYSFKVAQLATSTQYMSKGFASKNTALVKQEPDASGKTPPPESLGSITLSSGKARVDNSAELEDLNGGKGVYRGSVRVTDGSGTTSTIDLSSCVTLDDVVMKLNESNGAQISAYLKEGRLVVEDASNGEKDLKITNVGTGTTATDLGIVGSGKKTEAGVSVMEGRNVYIMGNSTSLSELNDGLGVETGGIDNLVQLKVANIDGTTLTFDVDLGGCETVGDVTKRVNDKIAELIKADTYDTAGRMHTRELEGLSFSVSEDGTSFALNGGKKNFTYEFSDPNSRTAVRQTEPAKQLGLTEKGAVTVFEDGEVIKFDRVFGGVNSPMLKNLSGANGAGVGSSSDKNSIDNYVPIDLDFDTPLSAMNNGKGLNLSTTIQFMAYEGGKYDADGNARTGVMVDSLDFLSPDKVKELQDKGGTIQDLITLINGELERYEQTGGEGAAAIAGLRVTMAEVDGRNMLAWTGAQSGYEYEVGGAMAWDLGLLRNEGHHGTVGMQTEIKVDKETGKKYGAVVGDPDDANYQDRMDQYNAIQDFLNGTTALVPDKSNDFLNGDGATLGSLANMANYPLDEDKYSYQMTDKDGNPMFEDDGTTPIMAVDLEAWLDDCKKILNGELMDDGSGNLIAGEGQYSLNNQLSGTFSITAGGETITVDWDDILQDFDRDNLVDVVPTDLIDAVNAAINEKAEAAGMANAPQMTVNNTGKGFGWTNVDFSSDVVIQGSGADALGLERDTTGDVNFSKKHLDTNLDDPPLMILVPGTSGYHTVTEENADQFKLSETNLGFGIDLNAAQDGSIDIYFGKADPDAKTDDRKSISIQINDVLDILNASGKDEADWTVKDYIDALNEVTEKELQGVNGVTDENPVSFKWGYVNGGFGMVETENFTDFTLQGDAVGQFTTGIGNALNGSVNSDGKFAQVGAFYVPYFQENPDGFDGVGKIDISLGNGAVVSLSTSGLTSESTLADLIDKLNSELDALADGSHDSFFTSVDGVKTPVVPPPYSDEDRAAFADIRFTINGSGTGIAVDNTSNKAVNFHDVKDDFGNTKDALARDLGLIKKGSDTGKVDAYSFTNGGSLGRDYISRASDLEEWIGTGAEKGGIRLTDTSGRSFSVDMSECDTIGDVIDAINMNYTAGNLAIRASINETGDGILIEEDWTRIYELTGEDRRPDADKRVDIQIEDTMGGCVAKKLGFSGKATTIDGVSQIDAAMTKTIDVMTTDTLEDVMYRISEAGYKAAIINDGKSYRLTVSASSTGKANDFVIESDVDLFDFNQTQQGRDAKALYGDPNSNSSPVMLSSDTNTNSNAILGLSLEMKQVSDEWTTITVDTDKDKVVEEITNMAQSYNDLVGIISMLDGYDDETGEKGILFGDSTVRKMMEEIDAFFYLVYDPYGLGLGGKKDGEQATWTWADMGIKLTAGATGTDASGYGTGWYSGMEVDTEKLESMVSSNWEVLSGMLYGERNAAAANAGTASAASASFNGALESGYDQVNSAINGDSSKSGWGMSNGIKGADTIENGSNSYSVIFNKPTTVTRMNLIFPDSSSSLKDYDIEYMDPVTGKWEKLRSINGNASDANYLSVTPPKEVAGMRIVASSTNASDGTFQLVDFQLFEEIGLASQLNQHVNAISDTRTGFLATQTNEITANIADMEDQMSRMQNRLDAKEASLWRKFNAMEQALAQLQNSSSYFSSMMGSMTNNSNS